MTRGRRFRRVGTRVGVVAFVVLVVLWLSSAWWFVSWGSGGTGWRPWVGIGDGVFGIGFVDSPGFRVGWRAAFHEFDEPVLYVWPWNFWELTTANVRQVVLPIWSLALIVLVPTAWLWRGDRARPGECRKCRYDLTGVTSGKCPECGAVFG